MAAVDPVTDPTEPRRAVGGWLAALASYLPLAVVGYLPAFTHWSAQMNGCNCWDQILEEWGISWFPHALAQGHPLFTTTYLDAPGGVNLLWDTTMPALSLLAAPFSAVLGPVHTFVVLSVLEPRLFGQHHVRPAPSLDQLVAGGLGRGPALRLLLLRPGRGDRGPPQPDLRRLPTAHRHGPRQAPARPLSRPAPVGLALGLLLVAQPLISEGQLVIVLLLSAVALVVAGPGQRAVLRERAGVLGLPGAVWAAGTCVVLAAYPLAVQLFGTDHLRGPVQSRSQLALFSVDLLSPVLPGPVQLIHPAWALRTSVSFSGGSADEVTGYLGIPLLAGLLTGSALLWKHGLVRLFALVGLGSFALLLGPWGVIVGTHRTSVPGPDALLARVPLVGDLIPARVALGMWFSVAVLSALCLHHLRRALGARHAAAITGGGRPRGRGGLARLLPGALTAAVAAACLWPLLPDWPYAQTPAGVPAFFTSSDRQLLGDGWLTLTYPYALTVTANPMLWQAETGMRFRLLGGYIIGPSPTGSGTYFADPNPLEYCFVFVYQSGRPAPGDSRAGSGGTVTGAARRASRGRRRHGTPCRHRPLGGAGGGRCRAERGGRRPPVAVHPHGGGRRRAPSLPVGTLRQHVSSPRPRRRRAAAGLSGR